MSAARNARRLRRRQTPRPIGPNDHQIVRAAGLRYAEDGCARCGGNGSTSTAVVLPDGSPICTGCLKPNERQLGIGTIHGVSVVPLGQEDDRRWFAANPDRGWRLRNPCHGEIEELVARREHLNIMMGVPQPTFVGGYDEREATAVFTYQVEPGARVRIPCTPPTDLSEIEAWVENLVLPVARRAAEQSMPVNKALTPEARALVLNAASIRQMPHADRFLAEAKAQGEAMRQAKGSTRQ